MESADWIIEIGPRAGVNGGELVFEGTPAQLKQSKSLTGQYLSGKKKVSSGLLRAPVQKDQTKISLIGAKQFNLKNVDLHIPLKAFTAIAGVSGSGKSTLMLDVFAKALQKEIMRAHTVPGEYKKLEGKKK
jgi:excinuclease ABC subunit A